MPLHDHAFYLDQWHVQATLNRVTGPSGMTQLEPRLMRVLVCLAEADGALVSREELLDQVWSDVEVTEGSLTHTVSVLRKLFGDEASAPRVIETIRGRGYRLLVPVRYTAASDGAGPLPELVVRAPSAATLPEVVRPPVPVWVWPLGVVALAAVGASLWMITRTTQAPPVYRIAPLTSLDGVELFPVFSPSGDAVAFTWFNPEGQPADLYVQQRGAESPVRLTDRAGAELVPAWSPDGTEIAYFGNDGTTCALHRMPSRGGASRKVLDTSCLVNGLTWSPDGGALIASIAEQAGKSYRLVQIPLDTRTPEDLTTPPAHLLGDMVPRFSPDGSQLGFLRYSRASVSDVYVLDLAEDEQDALAEPKRITTDGVNLMGFDWTRDGQSFVIASNRGATPGFWRVASTSGAAPTLIRAVTVNDPGALALSRTSPHLAYIDWTYEVNIHRVALNASGQAPEAIVTSSRSELSPQLSPDGTRLAFVANRSGTPEIWTSAADGQDAVQRTTLRHATTTTPQWSPDGSRLAFVSGHDGNAEVYVMTANGDVPKRLTTHPSQDVAPQWSPSGDAIYVLSDRSGTWQLWRVPLADDAEADLVSPLSIRRAEVSSDGTLYVTRRDTSGIWTIDLDAQQERLVANLGQVQWTATPSAIYFIEPAQGGATLFLKRHDLATGAVITAATIPADPLSAGVPWGFDVSDDERWLVYSYTDRAESDILLVEGFE